MNPHDDLCVCFHVSCQKVRKFVRLTRPEVPSRISECYGAGTGCGWCIPFLEEIWSAEKEGRDPNLRMTKEEYLTRRKAYHAAGSPRKQR
ncbi:MAG: hypothetical protein GHCLOJNM_01986 [bacterium]|nr:hypothetical protein [bacterium]